MSEETEKRKAGQPTKYKPEYCQKVIDYGLNGDTMVSLASELRVTKSTIYEWASVHKEFSDALHICKLNSEAYWLNLAKTRAKGESQGSDTIIKYILSAAHGLREGTDNTLVADVNTNSKVEIHFSELKPD